MRRITAEAPKGIPGNGVAGWTEQKRVYEFLTPVFGGGVKIDGHHKPSDERTPVRVPSIRGQLRFWWRAVNPQRCTTPAQLRAAEALIFGRATVGKEGPAEGVVEVRLQERRLSRASLPAFQAVAKPERDDPSRFKWVIQPSDELMKELGEDGANAIGYGAFPLRDTRRVIHPERPSHAVLHKYSGAFELLIRYRDDELKTWEGRSVRRGDQLLAAFWAWTQFGGLGARTRRGFGAITEVEVIDGTPCPDLHTGWIRWGLETAPAVDWPHLRGPVSSSVVEGPEQGTGLGAMAFLLRNLQILRQGSYNQQIGRNWRSRRDAGRSHWPEGDEIRRLSFHHPNHVPRAEKTGYPRYLFGLPIVFHFKDGPREGQPGRPGKDPPDSELVPDGKTRFSSPLILRPYGPGAKEPATPRAVRLQGSTPSSLELKGRVARKGLTIKPADLTLIPFKNLAPDDADVTDVIDLYLHLLRTR